MVERSIRIREARGSIPRFSTRNFENASTRNKQPQGNLRQNGAKSYTTTSIAVPNCWCNRIVRCYASHPPSKWATTNGFDHRVPPDEFIFKIKGRIITPIMTPKWDPLGSSGELAQMVERSLSMREVRGSMPRFSTYYFDEIENEKVACLVATQK